MILALAAAMMPTGDDIGIDRYRRRDPQPLPPPERRSVAQQIPREPSPDAAERIAAADAKRARKNAKRLSHTQEGQPK
jgi:hypothetical protein